jgi:drug/metabolite transporter (DMT)-like permease
MNWLRFGVLGAVAYVGIALMGYLGAGPADTVWQVIRNAYQPRVVALMLAANGLWIVAVYYGRRETDAATSMLVALGVVVIFVFYALLLGTKLTALKVLGVVLVLAGIYCLS